MQLTLPKLIWFVVALGISWSINNWHENAALDELVAAYAGNREAAQTWIDRLLDERTCKLHEAGVYLSGDKREFVPRPDFVEEFVEKIYSSGATGVEFCDSPDVRDEDYYWIESMVIGLPADEASQESVIADAQSFIRRRALVYDEVDDADVEEVVRLSALVGTRQMLVHLSADDE